MRGKAGRVELWPYELHKAQDMKSVRSSDESVIAQR